MMPIQLITNKIMWSKSTPSAPEDIIPPSRVANIAANGATRRKPLSRRWIRIFWEGHEELCLLSFCLSLFRLCLCICCQKKATCLCLFLCFQYLEASKRQARWLYFRRNISFVTCYSFFLFSLCLWLILESWDLLGKTILVQKATKEGYISNTIYRGN